MILLLLFFTCANYHGYENLFYRLTRKNPGSFSREVLLYLYIACQYCVPGGGGGYSHTLPIRVCAAQRGRDFKAPDLLNGVSVSEASSRTHESSSFVSSHLKLFKDRLLLKVRFNALARKLLYSCCTLCFGVLRGRSFDVVQ